MRLLANENIPGDAIAALREAGHDGSWVRSDARGSRDVDILNRAQVENRILISFDKDFGELAYRANLPATSGVILLRISAPSSLSVAQLIVTALAGRTDWAGHFAVIEDDRVRMSALP